MLSLTLEQIADLYVTCERLEARDRITDAWMSMTAAQGKVQDMKNFVKPLVNLLKKTRRGQKAKNDVASFLGRFGKGF